MLWEHEPTGECLPSLFKFFQTFWSVSILYNSIEARRTCSELPRSETGRGKILPGQRKVRELYFESGKITF